MMRSSPRVALGSPLRPRCTECRSGCSRHSLGSARRSAGRGIARFLAELYRQSGDCRRAAHPSRANGWTVRNRRTRRCRSRDERVRLLRGPRGSRVGGVYGGSRLHGSRKSISEVVSLMNTTANTLQHAHPLRVGIGGPVGSGKTALVEALCKRLRDDYDIYVITNDIYTKEDQLILTRAQALPAERIMGVETGCCPHTAIREDAVRNLASTPEMSQKFPHA